MADAPLSVLFENRDVLVVDKPAGIATEPGAKRAPSLRDAVAAHLGSPKEAPHAVSRLDLPVSGVVTFAISAHARRAFAGSLAEFRKLYVALVDGNVEGAPEVRAPIGGRDAHSRFHAVAQTAHARGVVTIAMAEPLTGRFHQLRDHAAALGAPVIGERRHGRASNLASREGRVVAPGRLLLHALAVSIVLDEGAAPIFCSAPIPAALRAAWSALDGAPEAWEAVARACDDWRGQRSSE